LNGTDQLQVYVDFANSLGEKVSNVKKNKEAPLDASKEVGRQVNSSKNKHIKLNKIKAFIRQRSLIQKTTSV
jgi:hypothetical protein